MKIKCYSVRLESIYSISNKAYKATTFNGSTAVIPKSQVFGRDCDVVNPDAYWISAWILEQKGIQYSSKKEACFDSKTGAMLPVYTITKHIPEKKEKVLSNEIEELAK